MDFYLRVIKVFSKTGHSLTDIIFAWNEFKALLHPLFSL